MVSVYMFSGLLEFKERGIDLVNPNISTIDSVNLSNLYSRYENDSLKDINENKKLIGNEKVIPLLFAMQFTRSAENGRCNAGNAVADMISGRISGSLYKLRSGNLLILANSGGETDFYNLIVVLCNEVITAALKEEINLNCFIGNIVAVNQLPDSLDQLFFLERCNRYFYGRIFYLDDCRMYNDVQLPDMIAWPSLLLQRKKNEIIIRSKTYLEEMNGKGKIDGYFLRNFHINFIQVFFSYLLYAGVTANAIMGDMKSLDLFAKAPYSIDNMLKWMNSFLDSVLEKLNENERNSSVVEKARSYIHKNYSENLKRENIADYVHVSADYLNRLFKKQLGTAIMEYVIKVRIHIAKDLLVSTDLNISAIAEKIGYGSISHFITMFKKETGSSPKKYRQQFR